jgi:uncharacterized cupredoxin-like copper-binding protein
MSIRTQFRRTPATAVPAIALAGAALLAAGCGSSSDNKSSDTGNSGGGTSAPKKAAPSAGGSVVTQSATEFKFSKPAATAKAGKVSIKLTNDGQVPHAIEIEDAPGGDAKSAVIQPGANTTLTANLKPGKYEFYCPVDSHKQQGMKGELTVK